MTIVAHPPAGAVLDQVVPLLVNTFPLVHGATTCTALVPFQRSTLLAVRVVAHVPQLATATVPVTLEAVPVVFWLRVGKVQLARLPLAGVPSAGVTNVGLVALAIPPVPVEVAPQRVSTIAQTVVSSRTVLAAAVIVAVCGTPVEAVVLPINWSCARLAIFARVTALLAIVYALVLFAEPLNEEPALVTSPVAVPIVLAFCRVVAVHALPETLVWSPVFVQLVFPMTVSCASVTNLLLDESVIFAVVVVSAFTTFQSPTSHFTIPVGVVMFGEVPNTRSPEPVSSVTRAFKLTDDGVAVNVSKPEARVTPAQEARSAS